MNKDELNEDNAADIYESLSELKGSALKVAQMLSMDKNILPTAYVDKFFAVAIQRAAAFRPVDCANFPKVFWETAGADFLTNST